VKRSTIIGVALGAGAAISIGVGLAVWSTTRPPSASDVAMTYFAALETGDADSALAVTLTPDADAEGIVDAYAAVVARVTDARVTEATEQSDTARVVVAYDVAGEPREDALELTRRYDGGWVLVEGTGTLIVDTTIGDAAGIGALVVPADQATRLLPGSYDVEPLPRGLVAGSASVVVTPGSTNPVSLNPSPTPEAATAAQAQLDAYADACTQPASAVPAGCGLRVPWAADLTTLSSIVFRVEERPALTLSPDARTFAATGGVVVATATGTTREGSTGTFTYRADDWALRGSVDFAGNEMVLSVY
jgi:mannose-6-phosphate isomerase-like protein (cupin superfamily)